MNNLSATLFRFPQALHKAQENSILVTPLVQYKLLRLITRDKAHELRNRLDKSVHALGAKPGPLPLSVLNSLEPAGLCIRHRPGPKMSRSGHS